MIDHYRHRLLIAALSFMLLITACAGEPDKPAPRSISSPLELLNRGIYHYDNNDYQQAIRDFDKALIQYRSIDNQTGIAKSCLNLAKTYMAVNSNHNAGLYLNKAENIIDKAGLAELHDHLDLLRSSLAIDKGEYPFALEILSPILDSNDISLKLAALQNRTRIAFQTDADDRPQWLDQYRKLQTKHSAGTLSHLARILRFDATASDDKQQVDTLLSQSLDISRQLASRPAIAATLTQWAQSDLDSQRYHTAEDKSLRALFIRHQLGDVESCRQLLQQLQLIYEATGDEQKQKLTASWIKKLSAGDVSGWEDLYSDFETYPVAL